MPQYTDIPTPLFGPGGGGNVMSGLAGAFMALPQALGGFLQQRRQMELDEEYRQSRRMQIGATGTPPQRSGPDSDR
jgi:hypothetical protein